MLRTSVRDSIELAALLWYFHRGGLGTPGSDELHLREKVASLLPPFVIKHEERFVPQTIPTPMASAPAIILNPLEDAIDLSTAASMIWNAYLDLEWPTRAHAGFEFVEKCKESVLFCSDFYVVDVRILRQLAANNQQPEPVRSFSTASLGSN